MHYSLLVIADGTKTLGEAMAPYQENNMGNVPREYLEFYYAEKLHLDEYETGSVERVRYNGLLLSPYDDVFMKQDADGIGFRAADYEVPEDLERIDVPLVEIYPTFDDYLREHWGYEDVDPETGRYGYWYNPNSKWDWYEVGGRWRGLIRAKVGAHGERSGYDFDRDRFSRYDEDSVFGHADFRYWRPYEEGRFDVARVRDIEGLNPYSLHDLLTPDGVWHNSEFYVPSGIDGRYFFENTWFRDGLLDRIKSRYPDCLAFVVDYHC